MFLNFVVRNFSTVKKTSSSLSKSTLLLFSKTKTFQCSKLKNTINLENNKHQTIHLKNQFQQSSSLLSNQLMILKPNHFFHSTKQINKNNEQQNQGYAGKPKEFNWKSFLIPLVLGFASLTILFNVIWNRKDLTEEIVALLEKKKKENPELFKIREKDDDIAIIVNTLKDPERKNGFQTDIPASFQLDGRRWEIIKSRRTITWMGYHSHFNVYKCADGACLKHPEEDFFEITEVQQAGVPNLQRMIDEDEQIIKMLPKGKHPLGTDTGPIERCISVNDGSMGVYKVSFCTWDPQHQRFMRYRYFYRYKLHNITSSFPAPVNGPQISLAKRTELQAKFEQLLQPLIAATDPTTTTTEKKEIL